jgi:hypothetical protein
MAQETVNPTVSPLSEQTELSTETTAARIPNTTDVSLGRIASQTVTLEEYKRGKTPIGDYSGTLVDADDPRLLNNRSVKNFGNRMR